MAERPAPAVARERQARLLERQRPIALARRRALVGQRLQVLVEGVCDESEHLLSGRHRGMAPEIDGRLLINDGFAPAGTLVEVEITDAFADDLVGHIVGPVTGTRSKRCAVERDPSPDVACDASKRAVAPCK